MTFVRITRPVLEPAIVGNDTTENYYNGEEWHQIACGARNTVAVTRNGRLFSWGRGGGLGDENDEITVMEPKPITTGTICGKRVIQVSCGSWHTAAITAEGEIHTWYESIH